MTLLKGVTVQSIDGELDSEKKLKGITVPFEDKIQGTGRSVKGITIQATPYCFLIVEEGTLTPIEDAIVIFDNIPPINDYSFTKESDQSGCVNHFVIKGDIKVCKTGFRQKSINEFDFTNIAQDQCIIIELEADDCINFPYENHNTFIRWRACNYDINVSNCVPFCGDNCGDISENSCDTNFKYDDYEEYSIPVVCGDTVSFIFNKPLSTEFANLKIGLAQCCNVIDLEIGVLQKYDIDASNYYIYCTFEVKDYEDGFYSFVIYDASTSRAKYISNPLRVVNHQNWQIQTKVLKFRSERNIYNIPYDQLPDFYQQIRVDMKGLTPQYPFEVEQYRSVTATQERRRNVLFSVEKTKKFETFQFDNETHAAFAAFSIHDEVFIQEKNLDFVKYSYKSNYQIKEDYEEEKTKGEIEFYESSYTEFIKNC